MSPTMIVRVTSTMFETADGREVPHPVPFDPEEVPSVEEFQRIYDQWFEVFRQQGLVPSADTAEADLAH